MTKIKSTALFTFLIIITSLVSCGTRQYLPIAVNSTPTIITEVPTEQPRRIRLITPSPTATIQNTPNPTTIPAIQATTANLQLPWLTKSNDTGDSEFWVIPQRYETNSADGKFTLILQVPSIPNQNSNQFYDFNQTIQQFLDDQTNTFLANLQDRSSDSPNGYLVTNYVITSAPQWKLDKSLPNYQSAPPPANSGQSVFNSGHPILSVLIYIAEYFGGAYPHEGHFTLNFDLETGQVLALDELFYGNSNYLNALSSYSISILENQAGLSEGEIVFGAGPYPENYNKWLITPQGILIIFEEYQVGSSVVEPQFVLIPYQKVGKIIRPSGPVGGFAQPSP